jgi:hypothetical protein
MAKYTLDTYGWSFEAVCKSLTDEQIQLIKDKMEEEGFTELHEIRFDLDELLDLDFWDGEVFHKTEAFDNGTMTFQVIDEEGNKVSEFDIGETADLYDTIEDYDVKYEYRGYTALPEYVDTPTNLYLSVDENKGGIFTFTLESDTVPVASDFTYSTGSIDTPEGDYDFIDKIFFKGQPLEIEDYLDNSGKSSSCMIFTLDGDTIN